MASVIQLLVHCQTSVGVLGVIWMRNCTLWIINGYCHLGLMHWPQGMAVHISTLVCWVQIDFHAKLFDLLVVRGLCHHLTHDSWGSAWFTNHDPIHRSQSMAMQGIWAEAGGILTKIWSCAWMMPLSLSKFSWVWWSNWRMFAQWSLNAFTLNSGGINPPHYHEPRHPSRTCTNSSTHIWVGQSQDVSMEAMAQNQNHGTHQLWVGRGTLSYRP